MDNDKSRYIGIILLVLGVLALIGSFAEGNMDANMTISRVIALVLTGVMIVAGIVLIIRSRR